MGRTDNLPFCDKCTAGELLSKNPLVQLDEPFLHISAYIDRVKASWTEEITYMMNAEKICDDLAKLGERPTAEEVRKNAIAAFVASVVEGKQSITDYLELIPADATFDELLALGNCARRLSAGECEITGSFPGYLEAINDSA